MALAALSANRISGISMLKAVLSYSGVEAGRLSSAHKGPSREADCVVAKMGIERVAPVFEVVRGEKSRKGRQRKQLWGRGQTSSDCFLRRGDTIKPGDDVLVAVFHQFLCSRRE